MTSAVDEILLALNQADDLDVKRKYINLLSWTPSLLAAAREIQTPQIAKRLIRLSVSVDPVLAAHLVHELPFQFQAEAFLPILRLPVSRVFKWWLFKLTGSAAALPEIERTWEQCTFFERSLAVDLLQRIQNQNAVQLLIRALQDRDYRLQVQAAEALGEIGGEMATRALTYCLEDKYRMRNVTLHQRIVHALQRIGSPEAQLALERALDPRGLENREHYSGPPFDAHLRSMSNTEAISRLSHALEAPEADLRYRAAVCLGDLQDDRAIPALVRALYDREPRVWKASLASLMHIRSTAAEKALCAILGVPQIWRRSAYTSDGRWQPDYDVDSIVQTMQTMNHEIRARLAVLLGCIPQPQAVNALIHALKDKSPLVRSCCVQALGQIGDRSVFHVVAETLAHDEASAVRCSAVDALTDMQHESVIPVLVQAMETDDTPAVRYRAVAALGRWGIEQVFQELLAAADKKQAMILKDHAAVGRKLSGESTLDSVLAGMDARVRRRILAGAAGLPRPSEGAVQALCQGLNHPEAEVRCEAARHLGRIGSETALGALKIASQDPQEEVRVEVMHALGGIQSEDSLDVLLACLEDCEMRVRQEAVGAIYRLFETEHPVGRMFDFLDGQSRTPLVQPQPVSATVNREQVAAELNKVAQDDDREVRRLAYMAMDSLASPVSVPVLIRVLSEEPESFLRHLAATALARIQAKESIPALIAALSDPEDLVSSRAAWTLGEMHSLEALDSLQHALSRGRWMLKHFAAEALGKIQHDSSLPGLTQALQDENTWVRKAAAWALGQLNHAEAAVHLIPLLEDADREVKTSAAQALGALGSPRMLSYLYTLVHDGGEDDLIIVDTIRKIQERCQYYNPELIS